MINVRVKGFDAERQIAEDLNVQCYIAYQDLRIPYPSTPIVQRNQNQSAVGGKDLIGTFGLAIEVKRQETLSINSWWNQCVISARNLNEIPVLLFKQNKLPWRCLLETKIEISEGASIVLRSEISYEDFKLVFKERVKRTIRKIKVASIEEVGLFGYV